MKEINGVAINTPQKTISVKVVDCCRGELKHERKMLCEVKGTGALLDSV